MILLVVRYANGYVEQYGAQAVVFLAQSFA